MRKSSLVLAALLSASLIETSVAQAADAVKIGVMLSADRQCRSGRPGVEGGGRARRRDRQQRASRTGGHCRSPRARACQSRRRQARADLHRSPGQPSVDSSQTLRLITQEKVTCMLGAYQSSCSSPRPRSQSATAFPSSSAIGRTQHHRARLQMGVPRHADRQRLRQDLHAVLRRHEEGRQGRSTIAIVNENTDYGTSVADSSSRKPRRSNIAIAIRIPYSASSTDVSGAGVAAQGEASRRRHFHQLHRRIRSFT